MSLPADPDMLADPDELAALSGIPADDGRLLAVLRAESRRFAGAVRHPVRLVDADTVILDGHGTRSLILPAVPVVAVTSVQVDGEELAADAYEWSADGLLERAELWPRRRRAIRVVYSHGYDPIPGPVSAAVIQAAHLALVVEPGVSSLSVGGMSISYGTSFGGSVAGATTSWTAAVEAYRINRGDRS